MVQKTYASWKRPSSNDNRGPAFRARPIKHWRKQLHSNNKSGRASIGMPMDRPGGSVVTKAACTNEVQREYARVDHVKSVCHIRRSASTVVGPLQRQKCDTTDTPRGAVSSSTRILQVKEQAIRYEKDKPQFIMNTPCERKHLRGQKTLCF